MIYSKLQILCLVLVSAVFCAQQIKVNVFDVTSKQLENINVQLQKNGRTLEFQKTNASGSCSFDIQEQGDYVLKFTSMLYKTETLHIDTREKTDYQVILTSQMTEIKEVVIKSRPKVASVKEDTISYNIKAVKDGTERAAEDLIKKLPGLDVNENGKVTFKGSPIGQMLVDGNELFGRNHKMATQNITADMLESVDLWQNYTTINGSRSTALNLKLKKEFQNKITGSVEGNYGNKNSYLGHLNLFQFSKAGNLAFIADANSIAKDPITYMDFHEMNTQENIENEQGGVMKIDVPSFLNNDGKVKSKDNQFGALQYAKSTKDFSISAYSIFNNAQLSKFIHNERMAFANQPLHFNFTEIIKEANKGFFGTTQIKFRKNFKDNSFLYYNLGYNPSKDDFQQNRDRFALQDDRFYVIRDNNQTQSFGNFLSWNKNLNPNNKVIFSYSQLYENQKYKLNISASENLFFSNNEKLHQSFTNSNQQDSFDFYWKNTNKVLNFNLHSGFKNQIKNINLGEKYTQNSEFLRYNYQFFTSDLFLRKQVGNFDFSASLKSTLLNVASLKQFYFEPFVRLKFGPKSLISKEFSLEFDQKFQTPETESLIFSNYYKRDLTFLRNINFSADLLTKTNNYRFSWHRFMLEKGNFLFMAISYSRSKPIFTNNTINYGNFSEIQNIIGDKNEQLFFVVSDNRKLGKNLSLNSKFNFVQSLKNSFINNQSNTLRLQNFELAQKLSTRFRNFPVQFDGGYSYQISKFSQSLYSSNSSSKAIKLSLGARAVLKEEWKANILGEYLIQKTPRNTVGNFLLGGQIMYQKKISPLEYNVQFNNVLNLNSFKYINTFISSFGLEDTTVTALHGYILGGIKFYF